MAVIDFQKSSPGGLLHVLGPGLTQKVQQDLQQLLLRQRWDLQESIEHRRGPGGNISVCFGGFS